MKRSELCDAFQDDVESFFPNKEVTEDKEEVVTASVSVSYIDFLLSGNFQIV